MKTIHYLTLSVVAAASTGALAQEFGRVISSQPVIQQVAVPRQVCGTQQVQVQQPKSGAGAVMGAIAGGAMGNAVGKGAGNAAATMIGIMGGAIVGDRIEGSPPPQTQNIQTCTTQTYMENRTVGYNVTYEYAGKQYSVQMPQDPGPTIALQVSPVGAPPAAPAALAPALSGAPVYQVPPVVQPGNVYLPYAAPVYYPPPVRFNFEYDAWDHRRWR